MLALWTFPLSKCSENPEDPIDGMAALDLVSPLWLVKVCSINHPRHDKAFPWKTASLIHLDPTVGHLLLFSVLDYSFDFLPDAPAIDSASLDDDSYSEGIWNLNWQPRMFTKVSPSSYIQITILPLMLRSLKFMFISPGSQWLFPAKTSRVFPCTCAGGIHQRNWSLFFLADNQGSFFAGLPSVIICSQLAWQPKLSFSPSRKTSLLCVLFPCNTVTKLVLNEKVRWMWVTCCASLLSRTLELIAAQCLKTFKSCHGKYIQVYQLSAAAW